MKNSFLYLQTLKNEGNFQKAANVLGVTQPYLSQVVKKLEDQYEVVIVDRRSKPIVLTKVGEMILDNLRQIDLIEQRTLSICQDYAGLEVGSIKIASNGERTNAILMPVIAKFSKLFPNIELDFSQDYILEDIPQILQDGKADVGMLFEWMMIDDLDAYRLCRERYMLVVPDSGITANIGNRYNDAGDYPKLSEVDKSALKALKLLQVYRHSERLKILNEALGFETQTVKSVVRQAGTRLAFVSSGLCMTICQEKLIKNYSHREGCRFISLEEVLPVQNVVIAWNHRMYQTKAAHAFCQMANEIYKGNTLTGSRH